MTASIKPPEIVASRVETNGINVIAESERKGTPKDLLWPWTAASISVLGIAYGAYALGYGCLLYTSPSPRDGLLSRMPSSA